MSRVMRYVLVLCVAIAATWTGGMRVPQMAVPGPSRSRAVCRAASASTA